MRKMTSLTKFWGAFLIAVVLLAPNMNAVAGTEVASQEIEDRLKALSTELRCLVCQNSTLADSDAELAQDLRNEIRILMQDGKTDEEVVDYLVERYGDFIRFRPPVNSSTALLWFGPFIMLIIGGITLFIVLRKHARTTDSEADQKSSAEETES